MDAHELLLKSNVITLAKRQDRAEGFSARFFEATGIQTILFNFGFDGEKMPIPPMWQTTKGAFGACLAHVVTWARVLSDEEYDEETPFLFFEDDAVFIDNFVQRLDSALQLLPVDWDIFYLGGEFLSGHTNNEIVGKDENISVAKVLNVNRMHAYAVKIKALRKMFIRLLHYMNNAPKFFGPSGDETCFDYEIGRMEEKGQLNAYATIPFIVGQGGFGSDTYPTSDASKTRFWN